MVVGVGAAVVAGARVVAGAVVATATVVLALVRAVELVVVDVLLDDPQAAKTNTARTTPIRRIPLSLSTQLHWPTRAID